MRATVSWVSLCGGSWSNCVLFSSVHDGALPRCSHRCQLYRVTLSVQPEICICRYLKERTYLYYDHYYLMKTDTSIAFLCACNNVYL